MLCPVMVAAFEPVDVVVQENVMIRAIVHVGESAIVRVLVDVVVILGTIDMLFSV